MQHNGSDCADLRQYRSFEQWSRPFELKGIRMADRELNGFEIWAEASQMGEEPAFAFVLTKDTRGGVAAKRFTVITSRTFTSLEEAQGAARKVVQGITSVTDKGVPSPLVY